MLCFPPDGLLQWQRRLEIIEKKIPTAAEDLMLLRRFALVYISENKLGILSPIRYFDLQNYPLDINYAQSVCSIMWELVRAYASVAFGPEFDHAADDFGVEM